MASMARPAVDNAIAVREHHGSAEGSHHSSVIEGDSHDPNAEDYVHAGVLSHTVIGPSTVQWIIPARIRDKHKNDVLFIGEKFVQIKELVNDGGSGRLDDVATKADFGHAIRAARVFGDIRERTSVMDSIVKAEDPDESIQYPSRKVPPQILALTLESHQLILLYATEDKDGYLDFVTNIHALPTDFTSLETLGEHLAVDPR